MAQATGNGVTKRREYLEEDLGALDVALSSEELSRIDAIMPPGAAMGERYPAATMGSVDR